MKRQLPNMGDRPSRREDQRSSSSSGRQRRPNAGSRRPGSAGKDQECKRGQSSPVECLVESRGSSSLQSRERSASKLSLTRRTFSEPSLVSVSGIEFLQLGKSDPFAEDEQPFVTHPGGAKQALLSEGYRRGRSTTEYTGALLQAIDPAIFASKNRSHNLTSEEEKCLLSAKILRDDFDPGAPQQSSRANDTQLTRQSNASCGGVSPVEGGPLRAGEEVGKRILKLQEDARSDSSTTSAPPLVVASAGENSQPRKPALNCHDFATAGCTSRNQENAESSSTSYVISCNSCPPSRGSLSFQCWSNENGHEATFSEQRATPALGMTYASGSPTTSPERGDAISMAFLSAKAASSDRATGYSAATSTMKTDDFSDHHPASRFDRPRKNSFALDWPTPSSNIVNEAVLLLPSVDARSLEISLEAFERAVLRFWELFVVKTNAPATALEKKESMKNNPTGAARDLVSNFVGSSGVVLRSPESDVRSDQPGGMLMRSLSKDRGNEKELMNVVAQKSCNPSPSTRGDYLSAGQAENKCSWFND
ncbi:unnamed protein product [Amoebophrya sp. A25]|nr:unnamed protein product [Amoebophrya sp. A25]|eukprot:GSA25T00000111001.1